MLYYVCLCCQRLGGELERTHSQLLQERGERAVITGQLNELLAKMAKGSGTGSNGGQTSIDPMQQREIFALQNKVHFCTN